MKTILVCAKNCGQRVAFQFDDRWPECHGEPMVREVHGENCRKVNHLGVGYLHGDADDSPYDVDGLMYCGRCHLAL